MNKNILFALLVLAACQKEAAKDPVADKLAGQLEEAKARPVAPAEGRRVDIVVSKLGYAPAKVDLEAGEPVNLVFTRVDDTKCGEEIVIPSINFKKLLPLNEPVAVVFTPDKAGEVGFACGMDMMKGTLVVQ
jgi:plastocyanin domain-containing protein